MGIVFIIVALFVLVLLLALFGGIDTIVDLVRGRNRREADAEVIADTRDEPEG